VADARVARIGDNGPVGDDRVGRALGRMRGALALAGSVEPREPVPRRAVRADIVLAAAVLALALALADLTYHTLRPAAVVGAAVAASVPLAARRRFPLAAFIVLVAGVLGAKSYATGLSFLVVVIAGYSAAVHSRFRGVALLCVALAGVIVAYVFWKGHPATAYHVGVRPGITMPYGGPFRGFYVPQDAPWRLDGLLVLVSMVSIAIVGGAVHAGERIRRLQAGHEAATRRALELERARIASELHDVVTHNVSVMIVQAGAARQVLDASPGQARSALLAVESSGRAAMSELRHLLGLLSPSQSGDPQAADAQAADAQAAEAQAAEPEAGLRPQPGLGRLPALIDRMSATGLPVSLRAGELPELPPGLDLAAFRVVQEALTNVLKHAGKPATSVSVDYRRGSLELEITDAGRLIPAAGPVAVPGSGRGLLGLRERVGVYGGELAAGPQPGGGWQVRARIPVGPLTQGKAAGPEPSPSAAAPGGHDGVPSGGTGQEGAAPAGPGAGPGHPVPGPRGGRAPASKARP
jgi:signal transduction histidine kinase